MTTAYLHPAQVAGRAYLAPLSAPQAPPQTPTVTGAPYSITKVDWSSGSTGAEQTIYFDEDGGNIVWDDAQRAAETGPIPYRRSSQTFIHGSGGDALEIGFHLAVLPPQCNDEVAAPVYEVFAPMRPAPNRWSAYPAMATFDAATDGTFLAPCKFVIKDQAGTVLGVLQMRDGLPISSPLLGQTRNETTALRPLVHTKMMLYWVSHRLKLSANARKWNNGMVPGTSNRPKQARQQATTNPSIPLTGMRDQQNNGFLHWLYAPKWPQPVTVAKDVDGPITDPNCVPANLQYTPSGDSSNGADNGWALSGYMYEPGAIACHDWRTPPGGNRFDRYFISSQLAAYLTEPDGVRPQGSVPYKLLAHEYGKGMFNCSHHEVTNVRTLETLPHEQVAYGQWAYCYGYYTPQGPIFVTGGQTRHIDQKAISNTPMPVDKDGRLPYHGAELDALHAYRHPGWYALMFNSVAFMVSAKLFYNAAMMSFGSSGSPTYPPVGNFLMQRMHAWRYLNQGLVWKLGTQHPIGQGQDKTQARFVAELEFFHDTVVVPATDPADPNYNSIYFTCLRNFGIPGQEKVSGSVHFIAPVDDAKLLYMAGVLATLKSTGAFDALRAVSVKCQKALDLVLACVRQYSVGRMNATHGRNMGLEGERLGPDVPLATPLVPLSGWTEWASVLAPVDGLADMVTNPNGTPYDAERQQYQHILVQAIFMMRDFMGDTSQAVRDACAITQEMEDRFAAAVALGQTADFTYRHPAAGILAAPLALPVSDAPPTVSSVVVTPATTVLATNTTVQFAAQVNGTGSPSQAVTWSKTGGGSIDAAGLFTRPAQTSSIQVITITATSQQDGTTGFATVTILALPIPNERLNMAKRDATQFINHIPIGQSGQRLLTTLVDSLIDDIKQLRDAQTIMAAKLDADAGVTDTNYSAVATVPEANVILGK